MKSHGHRQEADRPTAHRVQETRGYHRGERSAQRVDQSYPGTSLASRADRSSGLREARSGGPPPGQHAQREKQKSTRLNSSHTVISYAVFCLKKKKKKKNRIPPKKEKKTYRHAQCIAQHKDRALNGNT